MSVECSPQGEVTIDIEHEHDSKVFDVLSMPIWMYNSTSCCNIWGNRAALKLFGLREAAFRACQLDRVRSLSPLQQQKWQALNARIHELQAGREQLNLTVSNEPVPGFLELEKEHNVVLKATLGKAKVLIQGKEQTVCLIQVTQQSLTEVEEDHPRMVAICNNHPMYQFLFDDHGQLLTANKRAMYNLKEHLKDSDGYDFKTYLSMGECDGSLAPDEMFLEAMRAIFIEGKHCHRFPQLRWSKRHPGKFRWVLFEMWPLTDPITRRRAVLVCEQNISQVKALEEQFKRQNRRLEAQLEEALAQRDIHKPAIDIDTPADKTLKLLDKIMRGHDVGAREAMELRDAILDAGDLRQPVNFNEQLMKNSQTVLDSEVSQSLIQLLSSKRPAKIEEEAPPSNPPSESHSGKLPHLRIAATQPVTQESVHRLIAITKDMPDKMLSVLAKVDDWQFDAFELNEVSNGRPLSMLSFALFKRFEIAEKWQMDDQKLAKFLMKIEDGYPRNPYHNRVHAADVLRSLHVLVLRGGLIDYGYCDDINLFSCYLSSIIHDYEHKGVNNDYLVRVSDDLAVLYNDRSPMENHHLAASFQLMNREEFNFMPKAPNKLRESIRKLVIDMVLATDMKQHFAIHSMFQAKMHLNGNRPANSSSSKSMNRSPLDAAVLHDAHLKPVDDDQKSFVLQVALKCADLGHLSAPRNVHRTWVQYLEEEFFRQGDREKANELTVSPLMDREKNGITKSQVGFFDIVALPLFQSFAQAFTDATPMLDSVKDNYHMWCEEAALCAKLGPSPPVSGTNSCLLPTINTLPKK